jgi:hypothetical protein
MPQRLRELSHVTSKEKSKPRYVANHESAAFRSAATVVSDRVLVRFV